MYEWIKASLDKGGEDARKSGSIIYLDRESTEASRSTFPEALITEGESLLIGGMVRDSSGSGVSKVPVLGDVPVLGHLFRTDKQNNSRIERMFLITPRLARAGQPAGESALRGGAPQQAPRVPDPAPRNEPATTVPVRPSGPATPAPLPPAPSAAPTGSDPRSQGGPAT